MVALLVAGFLDSKIKVTGKEPLVNSLVSAVLCLSLGLAWPVLALGLLIIVAIALFTDWPAT
jgi:hypothetical protein